MDLIANGLLKKVKCREEEGEELWPRNCQPQTRFLNLIVRQPFGTSLRVLGTGLADPMAKPGRGKTMPVAERLTLSPWMKWRKYGRVPWKFLIHMALTVLVTAQVSFLNRSTSYVEDTQASLVNMFVPSSMELDGTGPRGGTVRIHTYAEFADSLSFLMDSYAHLSKFVGTFTPQGGAKMAVDFADHLGPAGLNWTNGKPGETYVLKHPPYGPFQVNNLTQVKEAAGYMDWVEVQLLLHNVDRDPEDRYPPACWQWDVRHRYDFRSNSHIHLDFRMYWKQITDDYCRAHDTESRWWTRPNSSVFWISLAVIGLAIASLVLTVRSLARSFQVYRMVREHYRAESSLHLRPFHAPVFWESLSFSDKLRFFNLWVVATLVCDICCIASSVLYLAPSSHWSFDQHWWIHLLMGLGAAFAWVQNTQYFEFDKEMAIILLAMRTGLPYILRLVVAIGPVFIGYVLFGWTFFGAFADTFRSFGDSAITLFCIVNGDDMHATFEKYTQEDEWIGRLFLVSFVMCFIYCVLNVFIYIMEDAVHSTKLLYKRNTHSSVFGNGPDLFFDDQLLAEMLRPFNSAPDETPRQSMRDFQPFATPPRSPLSSFRGSHHGDLTFGRSTGQDGVGDEGGEVGSGVGMCGRGEELGSGLGLYGRLGGSFLDREIEAQKRTEDAVREGGERRRWDEAGRSGSGWPQPTNRDPRIFSRWDQIAGGEPPRRREYAPPMGSSSACEVEPPLNEPSHMNGPNEAMSTPRQSADFGSTDSKALTQHLTQTQMQTGQGGRGLRYESGPQAGGQRGGGLLGLVAAPTGRHPGRGRGDIRDDSLREPLLAGTSDSEGEEGGGGEAAGAGTRQADGEAAAEAMVEVQRLFVLDHIFDVQERMHMKHLNAFSARLAALEKDHQRSLAEVQQHFIDMVDRRLQRIFANPTGGSSSFRAMSLPRTGPAPSLNPEQSAGQRVSGGSSRRGSFRQASPAPTSPTCPCPQPPPIDQSQRGPRIGGAAGPHFRGLRDNCAESRHGLAIRSDHRSGSASVLGSRTASESATASGQRLGNERPRLASVLGSGGQPGTGEASGGGSAGEREDSDASLGRIAEPEGASREGSYEDWRDWALGSDEGPHIGPIRSTERGEESGREEDETDLESLSHSRRTSFSESDAGGAQRDEGQVALRGGGTGGSAQLADGWGLGRGGLVEGESLASRRWTGGSDCSPT